MPLFPVRFEKQFSDRETHDDVVTLTGIVVMEAENQGAACKKAADEIDSTLDERIVWEEDHEEYSGNSDWDYVNWSFGLDEDQDFDDIDGEIQEYQKSMEQKKLGLHIQPLDAVTLIKFKDAKTLKVEKAQIYPLYTALGEPTAKNVFKQWIAESQDKRKPYTDKKVEAAWKLGKIKVGKCFIMVVRGEI